MGTRNVQRAAENDAEYNEYQSKKIDVEPDTKEEARQVDALKVKNITTGPLVHLRSQIFDQILDTFQQLQKQMSNMQRTKCRRQEERITVSAP